MIVAEPYQRDGRTLLRNLQHAASVPPGYVDTGLSILPGPGVGKVAWDAQARTATPLRDLPATEGEKLDRLDFPRRVEAAQVIAGLVALGQAGDTTPAERTWARGVLLDARDRARDARAASVQAART